MSKRRFRFAHYPWVYVLFLNLIFLGWVYNNRLGLDTVTQPTIHVQSAPLCKWQKYATWPYAEEFPQLSKHPNKYVYVKTGKTGGTTIAVKLRNAWNRQGLNIIGVDPADNNDWWLQSAEDWKRAVNRTMLPGHPADAVAEHMFYHSEWVGAALHTDSAFRLTSVRETLSQLWSMWRWDLTNDERRNRSTTSRDPVEWFNAGKQKNPMTWFTSDHAQGIQTTSEIVENYDHIFVMERMLESFAVLAPKMGLMVEDMFIEIQNPNPPKHNLPQDVVRRFEEQVRSKATDDFALYKAAVKKLDDELEALPMKIKRILGDVRQMHREAAAECAPQHILEMGCNLYNSYHLQLTGDDCRTRCYAKWADRNVRCAVA